MSKGARGVPEAIGSPRAVTTAMTATALTPTRTSAQNCLVSLIDSPLSEPVMRLLGCSRWRVERTPDVDAAVQQIERGLVPVVMCDTGDWRTVADAAQRSPHPPGLVVLTASPNDREWLEVLGAGAHYLPVSKLDAARLFSLLNLLWRGWRKA